MTDNVNNPSHYQCENATITIEPIELCEQCGFLLGNALKYLFRYQHKGKPLEDLQKAEYYLKRYLDTFSDLQVDHRVFDDEGIIFNAFKGKEFLKDWRADMETKINIKHLLKVTQKKIKEFESD